MIRIPPALESTARLALHALGVRVLATDEYAKWILRSTNTQPPVSLLVVGTPEAIQGYRIAMLEKEENLLQADGSIHTSAGSIIRFAESFESSTATLALDLLSHTEHRKATVFNEGAHVFIDGKRTETLTHNSTGDWDSLIRRVKAPNGGAVTIRDSETGPVLAEWTVPAPPLKTPDPAALAEYSVSVNGASRGLFTVPEGAPQRTIREEADRRLTGLPGGAPVIVRRVRTGLITFEYKYGTEYMVKTEGGFSGRFFLAPGESVESLAAQIGVPPGEYVAYATPTQPGERIVWKGFTVPKPPAVPLTAVYLADDGAGFPRAFQSSPTDPDQVARDARRVFPAAPKLTVMAKSPNAQAAPIGYGYWTKV